MTRTLCLAIRSFLLDLLPIPWPATHSEVLVFFCRLLGCAAIVGIATVSIQHAGVIAALQALPFALLVMTVALAVGNLMKELAILIGGIAINWLGVPFLRMRLAKAS
jgi:hypothetical protein